MSCLKFHSVEYHHFLKFMLCLVHPCDRDHGCQQQCIKDDSAEKFHCECKSPEYTLAADKKNCIEGNLHQVLTINCILVKFIINLINLYSLLVDPIQSIHCAVKILLMLHG